MFSFLVLLMPMLTLTASDPVHIIPDVNECLISPGLCGPRGKCINLIGSYTCLCAVGLSFTNGSCTNVTSLPTVNESSALGALCQNTSDSSPCMQPATGNMSNICTHNINPCGWMGTCQNLAEPNQYSCICSPGYRFDNSTCVDINECTEGGADRLCPGGICVNMPGAYACTNCPSGFQPEPANGTCWKSNECADDLASICGPGTCHGATNGFICVCPPGFQFVNGTCLDIDECIILPVACGVGIGCNNTIGSYRCD
ncbi:latent-transforming growth factor beta-binding protein 2-like isoform X2 [Paramacrobiotus metropolitanus]|uniref:latent-transforming growth factor beta-binding protein 2-like isoform X2 n=1 Tax=Paramacrobiotus metropolitanus TaxID=2943436 RepID=UPI002445997E|nr:latent-transforming growth factor beta-binding protein 2-like isoform X2 [Paramacrobiotus metropolitanus]XP_055328017.1 latent-transforming growth factor beta-binding protein 2-like isoform X2 [Paramacrobiotus metropolitanus]